MSNTRDANYEYFFLIALYLEREGERKASLQLLSEAIEEEAHPQEEKALIEVEE